MIPRKTSKPDTRPIVDTQARGLRGGAYERAHDTPKGSWLYGGDPSEKPGYVKGMTGQQQKLRRRKWPF
jgi:hypothetical protein